MSSREQWRLDATFLVKSSAEASDYLQKLLQKKMQTPPASVITAPQSLALSSPFKAIMLNGQGAGEVIGSAQVTVVRDKLSHTTEVVGQIAPQHLAGASPHAPDPPRRGKKRIGTKDSDLNIRMTSEMKGQLGAKCTALETYPSAYVLELVAADLGLPTDEHRATRNKYLKKAFADLRVAFDDCGVNLNQMAKATNSGKPCPLTRPEINKVLADFARGCRILESLRP
ncbi:MAG: hypothetical protein WCD70_04640 [Alphaproteobacteria bacterium]